MRRGPVHEGARLSIAISGLTTAIARRVHRRRRRRLAVAIGGSSGGGGGGGPGDVVLMRGVLLMLVPPPEKAVFRYAPNQMGRCDVPAAPHAAVSFSLSCSCSSSSSIAATSSAACGGTVMAGRIAGCKVVARGLTRGETLPDGQGSRGKV